MRTEIYNYIKGLSLGSFKLSDELPFDASGNPLYVKNKKCIYVDNSQTVHDTLIYTLDALDINAETTTVRVYVTTDAKQLPTNYSSLVSSIKTARSATTIQGVNRREVDVTSSYIEDAMITAFEFRFTKIT
jgi:hypothetical protein